MTDHSVTPSTDSVRHAYAYGVADMGFVTEDEASAEFDRWLLAYILSVLKSKESKA